MGPEVYRDTNAVSGLEDDVHHACGEWAEVSKKHYELLYVVKLNAIFLKLLNGSGGITGKFQHPNARVTPSYVW